MTFPLYVAKNVGMAINQFIGQTIQHFVHRKGSLVFAISA